MAVSVQEFRCLYCQKPVSKANHVHTACRLRKDIIDNIDDPAGSEHEGGHDRYGNETE